MWGMPCTTRWYLEVYENGGPEKVSNVWDTRVVSTTGYRAGAGIMDRTGTYLVSPIAKGNNSLYLFYFGGERLRGF